MKTRIITAGIIIVLTGCKSNEARVASLKYEMQSLREKCIERDSRQADILKADTAAAKGMLLVGGIKKYSDEYLLELQKKDSTLYHKAVDYNVMVQEAEFLKNVVLRDISQLKDESQSQYQKSLDSLLTGVGTK